MFHRPTVQLMILFLLVGSAIIFSTTHLGSSSPRLTREELDKLWEQHMFSGTSAVYSDGKRTSYNAEHSFEWAKGMLSIAWLTKQGIAVSDLRETSWLGLFWRGGWVLEGGLLAKIQSANGTWDLYGKRVVRADPVFVLNLHLDKQHEHSIELFLLRRNRQDQSVQLIKKWTLDAAEIKLDPRMSLGDVKVFLSDYVEGKNVTLVVVGLKRSFEERIDISKIN